MTDNENPVSKEFPKLFHYTSVSAFKNIYKENKFRATHHEDLNDKSEFGRFKLDVCEFIKPKIRKIFHQRMQHDTTFASKINRDGGLEKIIDQEATMHLDALHQTTFGKRGLEVFVCSFCYHDMQSYEAKNGLLSQWRGYGIGDSVAIVLKTQDIEQMMEYERKVFKHRINHIGNVIYDDRSDEIRKEFYKVFDCFSRELEKFYSRQGPNYEEMFDHFIQGSTLVKHHAFHEENEVRIVVSLKVTKDSIFYNPEYDVKQSKIVRYMQKGDREVRYIELFGHTPLPIERVIVGPSRIQNVNFREVSDLVKNSDIEVVKSDTPFLV
jgi:hypothetical protein